MADFIAAKRGLASALHSGDPAFDPLPAYFKERLQPALETLLASAVAAGTVRLSVISSHHPSSRPDGSHQANRREPRGQDCCHALP